MPLIIAFLVAVLSVPLFRSFGKQRPSRFGGVAVLLALVLAIAVSGEFGTIREMIPYWSGLAVVFATGMTDDLITLRPFGKLIGQSAAAVVFLAATGLVVEGDPEGSLGALTNPWLAALSFFWIIGITNAFNLLDNMDGLTPGVGALCALGLFLLGIGDSSVELALAGALAGFLIYNFAPASIYLGDSGSHLVGFSLAVLPFFQWSPVEIWLIPVLFFLPILDTVWVVVLRIQRGISPFQGGRDHISHQLITLGLPPRLVAGLFYIGCLLLILTAWAFRSGIRQLAM